MINLIANSQQQRLIDHLTGVMYLSYEAAKFLGANDDLAKYAAVAGYLHDIGKCSDYFQNSLMTGFVGGYPRHNEISWVFTMYRMKDRGVDYKKIIPQAVYWHHGTKFWPDEMEERDSDRIKNECHDWDQIYDRMSELINHCPKDLINLSDYLESEYADTNVSISSLYEEDKGLNNAKRMLVRSSLIFADRKISSLSPDQLINRIENKQFKDLLPKDTSFVKKNFSCPDGFDPQRFDLQKDIVSQCDRTTLVKAPAGFGKTMIGLLWGLNLPGPLYWVCPRNTVAQGVYQNIKKDLNHLNETCSVELFLTGEQQESTHNKPPLTSDIIVTNIDNLLATMVNSKLNDLYQVNMANVVMDEYHELIADEALFGAFLTLMRARHSLYKNVQTLLVTATPGVIHSLWDEKESNPVKVLPNQFSHYPPQHNKPYSVSIKNNFVKSPEVSCLSMYSSIKNVQNEYTKGYDEIIHSKYSIQDRNTKLDNILKSFGPKGSKDLSVVAAPVLQAALDVSFTGLFKTIESPESELQTLGRVNRWGQEDTAKVCFLDLTNKQNNDKGEKSAIRVRYDLRLHEKWKTFLITNYKPIMTLQEWYVVYNIFIQKEQKNILQWLEAQECFALKKLKKLFPKQNRNKNDDKVRSGRNLRSSNVRPFLVVKDTQGQWCNFTMQLDRFEINDILNDPDNQNKWSNRSIIIKTWKQLNKKDEFNFEEMLHKYDASSKGKKRQLKINILQKLANVQETPLPVYSYEYSPELGLIKRI